MPWAPATADDVQHMLATVGDPGIDELFARAGLSPASAPPPLDIPDGLSEVEVVARAARFASRTVDLATIPSFLGSGSYDHHVPAACRAITARSEFATAYTPYQPELSQGTLQSIFEFQSCIAAITGLPVANASLYDGATAAAEAMYLAEQVTGRSRVIVLGTVAPQVRRVLDTYAGAYGIRIDVVGWQEDGGVVDVAAVEDALGDDVAALIVQQPNAFGMLEDAPALVAAAHERAAVAIVHADPLSLGLLEAPGAYGADVVVGDGQPLGCAPSFGGPAFGFMAAGERYLRRMPGRIVGETLDAHGERGYVLTLQTREQHIRREKATSNICTNQALCALSGAVYLSWLGPSGLERLAALLLERAGQVRSRLERIDGVRALHDGPAFREFVVELPVDASAVVDACLELGVLAGWPAGRGWPQLGPRALQVAVTERRTEADIELLATALEQAIAQVRA